MNPLSEIPSVDLLEELANRGDVRIVQAEQRVNGIDFANNLSMGDELRVTALRMAALMLGRTVADDANLFYGVRRRMKTSASEDFKAVAFMATAPLIQKLLTKAPIGGGESVEGAAG